MPFKNEAGFERGLKRDDHTKRTIVRFVLLDYKYINNAVAL